MKKILIMIFALTTTNAATAGDCSSDDSIVDVALKTEALSTLVQAVVKADLVEFLDGNRSLTVFAPTNEAFDATAKELLGEGSSGPDLVDFLGKDDLTGILKYHIAPGERYAVDVLGSTRVRTLSKEFTFPSLDENDMPFINDSPIVQPDVPACNGVVHVIGGAVLLP